MFKSFLLCSDPTTSLVLDLRTLRFFYTFSALLPELEGSAEEGFRFLRFYAAGFCVMWIIFRGECFLRQFASLPNTTAKSFADSRPEAGVLSCWQLQFWHGSQTSSAGSARTSGALGPISKANSGGLPPSISENKRSSEHWGQLCIVGYNHVSDFFFIKYGCKGQSIPTLLNVWGRWFSN